jgi:co-chaperonin GroES (HSP10)
MTQKDSMIKTTRKPLTVPDWVPSGNKILLQLDTVESYSNGGIFIIPKMTERDAMNQTEGTVAALGPLAYKDMRAWDTTAQQWVQIDWLKVGDRVRFQRHTGWVYMEGEGSESIEYRVMHDTDITMVLRQEANHE